MRHPTSFPTRLTVAGMMASVVVMATGASVSAAIHPGSYVTITHDATAAAGKNAAATATCPSGDVVVSGGAYWHRAAQDSDATLETQLRGSSPKPDLSGWSATGHNGSAESLVLTSIAQCLPSHAVGAVDVLTRTVLVDSQRAGNADLQCPSGDLIVTGGGSWHKPGAKPKAGLEAFVTSSLADNVAGGWSVVGSNMGTTTLDLAVIVVCVRASALGGTYTTHSNNVSAVAYGDTIGTYATCTSGHVIAGGAAWVHPSGAPRGDTQNEIESSSITADGTGWYASARNTDTREGASAAFVVELYCE